MSNVELFKALNKSNNRYLLGIWDNEGLRTEQIDVYDDVLLSTTDSVRVIQRIADPETHVITLTITEKGYHYDTTNNCLDFHSQPISYDINNDTPKTAIGILAQGLIQRHAESSGPLTVISCDNLAENGTKLNQVIRDYLSKKAASTLKWCTENLSFPNTMVDRITPKLDTSMVSQIQQSAGKKGWPTVGTEAFSEWVIEDKFVSSRPPWDSLGAVFVSDVTHYEERKLRLLNAAHSYLAYAGIVAGYKYVHDAINDKGLRDGVLALWEEAEYTLTGQSPLSLTKYRTALLKRFEVEQVRHELAQIAMDGTLKIPERLTPILKHRSTENLNSTQVSKAIATWVEFVRLSIQENKALSDPKAVEIAECIRHASDFESCCSNLAPLIGLPNTWHQ